MRTRLIAAVVGLTLAACGSRPERRDPPPADPIAAIDAGMVDRGPGVWVRVTPADARIEIDGAALTPAEQAATGGFLSLEQGLHQIVVTREGYKTWRAEVTVREQTEPIVIELEALAPPP